MESTAMDYCERHEVEEERGRMAINETISKKEASLLTGRKMIDGNKNRIIDIATAILHDDSERVKEIIERGDEEKDVETEAMNSCGRDETMEERGFDSPGSTLCRRILEAVEFNSLKCLEYLLETYEQMPHIKLYHRRFGLNWPVEERPKESPLHLIASRCSALGAMKVVEKYSCFMQSLVDEPDSVGSSPLLIAVKRNNIEVAKCLMNNSTRKPAIDKRNSKNESPIYLAALNGQTVIMKEMLKEYSLADIDGKPDNHDLYGEGHSILYPAARSGNPDILEVLLKEEQTLSFLDREKRHADWEKFVCNVCALGCKTLLTEILELDNDTKKLDCKDENGATPLMRAVEADNVENLRVILDTERGRETISWCDNEGRNVFHYAVKHLRVLEYLLKVYITLDENNKVINEKADDGSTPLKLAVDGGFVKSFEMLLKYKTSEADLFCRPFVGYTNKSILKLALEDWERRDPEAVSSFLAGDKYYPPLLQAAAKGDIEMMEFLLDKGASEKQIGFDDSTALHRAVVAGKRSSVEFLIKKFPNMIDWTNDCGQTAAGCATDMGNVEILKLLLDKGARVTSDKTDRINLLDCAFGHFKKAESTIKEIINFYKEDKSPNKLKEVMEDSHFGPSRLMSKLVEDIPSAAVEILNQCHHEEIYKKSSSYNQMSEERKVTYHFFPIQAKENNGELEVIESMVKNRRDECLKHPVVVKFLNKKLSSPNVYLWIIFNILLYMMFLTFLMTYTGLQTGGSYDFKSLELVVLSILTLSVCILNLVKEILQVIVNRKEYFYDLNNYIEWAMYTCAIVYVIQLDDQKSNLQRAAGAIALTLSWINFVWFLKMFSLFGIYIIMAEKVFITICKVLPMVVFFIVAFALAFFVLMPQDSGFNTIPTSFLTTFVMMTGEVDFRGTFLASGTSSFHALQRLFLIVFLLLVTIAIMNLLTGLAVGDTNEIMERSRETKRLHKAKLVITLERTLHDFPLLSTPIVADPLIANPEKRKRKSFLLWLWEKAYKFEEA